MWAREEGAERRGSADGGFHNVYTHSEQEKKEEKGVPIILAKGSKAKMIAARVVPRKEVENYAADIVKRMVSS